MGWVELLRGHLVGVDTAPLIYFTEENPQYIHVITPFLRLSGAERLPLSHQLCLFSRYLFIQLKAGTQIWRRNIVNSYLRQKG